MQWNNIGKLSVEKKKGNCPSASYKSYETTVLMEGEQFRAIVIHSDNLDKRRQKKIQNELNKDLQSIKKQIKQMEKTTFACLEDAKTISEEQAE